MLQAWIVLPALAVGYLLAAPVRLRRRLWQLGVAGAVMLAVSLSWIALYTFTPTSDRPYVDGSTNNSAIASVFGYNGLERSGINVKGAVTSGPGVTTGGTGGAGQPARHRSDQEPGRLRNHRGRRPAASRRRPKRCASWRRGPPPAAPGGAAAR